MNLSEMRTRVRRDLHDEDPANQRWSDDELNRHIERAVRELSLAAPLEAKATLATSDGSRDVSLASLSDLVAAEAAEYPTGKYPPSYVPFSLWAGTLTLLVEATPPGGQSVNVYYGKMHTLDATTSTIPPHLEEVVATGAAAYAALEWASFATNRINVGGQDVWRDYFTWGQERLAVFSRALAKHSRRNAVRVRRLYTPATQPVDQSTVWQW
ncbi:MAG: phage adaptor protein [Dehalococcoidia bacterium]